MAYAGALMAWIGAGSSLMGQSILDLWAMEEASVGLPKAADAQNHYAVVVYSPQSGKTSTREVLA